MYRRLVFCWQKKSKKQLHKWGGYGKINLKYGTLQNKEIILMMNSPVTIAYWIICGVYFVASIIFALVSNKKIPKKMIIILSIIMTLLFVAFSIYFWTVDAKVVQNALKLYLGTCFVGLVTGVAFPVGAFVVKNASLLVKDTVQQVDSQERDKLALLIGYEKMLKQKVITQEEYDQKEKELFNE